MSKFVDTKLGAEDLARAQEMAKDLTIAELADVLALGADVQRKIQALDPEIDKVTMKDLGPIGDLMLELEDTMGAFAPGDVFTAEATWFDELVDKISFLRQWFGPLARAIKQYQRHSAVVKSLNAQITEQLNIMTADASIKDGIEDRYKDFEIDLLVVAKAADIVAEKMEVQRKALEKKGKKRTARESQEMAELQDLIDLVIQRQENLKVASSSANQTWVGLAGSSKAQGSLIEKLSFGRWFNEAAWKSAARAAISALRMMKAAEVVERHQRFTEAMQLTAAELQEQANAQGLTVGTKAILSIALLEKINELRITGIQERRQIITDWKNTLDEADQKLLTMRTELHAALDADLNA